MLNGGSGNDSLTGGTGSDTFLFSGFTSGEADQILDFENGTDVISLQGVAGATAADRYAALTITDVATGVAISYGGHSITLSGLASSDISQGDFVFV